MRTLLQSERGALVSAYPDRDRGDPIIGHGGGKLLRGKRLAIAYVLRLSRKGTVRPAVAYVHIPFCERICPYCGFYRELASEEAMDRYTEALVCEVTMAARYPLVARRPLAALHFGGGTPTLLGPKRLRQVLRAFATYLPWEPDREWAIETTLSRFTEPVADTLRSEGITRVSFGVQALSTHLRRFLGRRLPREAVLSTLKRSLNRGFATAADIQYGIPAQTLSLWLEDIRVLKDLGIHGMSLYDLKYYSGTPLTEARDAGQLDDVPAWEALGEMFLQGRAVLLESGFEPVFFDHLGRSPEQNLYLRSPALHMDCLPFGVGASGRVEDLAIRHVADVASYCRMLGAGCFPLAWGSVADPTEMAVQDVCTELAGTRVSEDTIRVCSGSDGALWDLLISFQNKGLVVREGNDWVLTGAGCWWVHRMIRDIGAVSTRA